MKIYISISFCAKFHFRWRTRVTRWNWVVGRHSHANQRCARICLVQFTAACQKDLAILVSKIFQMTLHGCFDKFIIHIVHSWKSVIKQSRSDDGMGGNCGWINCCPQEHTPINPGSVTCEPDYDSFDWMRCCRVCLLISSKWYMTACRMRAFNCEQQQITVLVDCPFCQKILVCLSTTFAMRFPIPLPAKRIRKYFPCCTTETSVVSIYIVYIMIILLEIW